MRKVLVLLCVLQFLHFGAWSQPPVKPVVIAYYTGDGDAVRKFPLSSITHLIYSFLKLDGDTLAFQRPMQQDILRKLVALKKDYPNLKIMVSIGGWGGCAPCSPAFSNPDTREKFARSVVKLLSEFGADGLDLDWEYPGIEGFPGHAFSDQDVPNFTDLVKRIRAAMGKRYILSFAAGGFTKYLEASIEWKKVAPLVDYINLMTYDLVNGYSKQTGHHTALHATAQQPEATDHCVDYLLKAGVPARKLVIGAAFYARVWKNVPSLNNGLFQPGEFKTMLAFRDFETGLSAADGFVNYWDETSMAPYSYSAGKLEFATYDNERSVAEKTRYVLNKRLGGIMFWELTNDKYSGGLLDQINQTLQEGSKK